MKRQWPQKVYPQKGGDWRVTITSQMAVDLFPKQHTLRAALMIMQIGYTCRGRVFSITSNARNCWEVSKTQISRAKLNLKMADLLVEIPQENNGKKRKYKLSDKAFSYHSFRKKQCKNKQA